LQITKWQAEEVARVREAGYVAMATSGRKRWLPSMDALESGQQGAVERAALNTACQGAAADIVKWSMLRLEERFAADRLAGDVMLCLQVQSLSGFAPSVPPRCNLTARLPSQYSC
jgi:DNA polymerase-1